MVQQIYKLLNWWTIVNNSVLGEQSIFDKNCSNTSLIKYIIIKKNEVQLHVRKNMVESEISGV